MQIDKYELEHSDNCWVLTQKRSGTSKSGEEITVEVKSYHGTVKQALDFMVDLEIGTSVAKTAKDIIKAITDLGEKLCQSVSTGAKSVEK